MTGLQLKHWTFGAFLGWFALVCGSLPVYAQVHSSGAITLGLEDSKRGIFLPHGVGHIDARVIKIQFQPLPNTRISVETATHQDGTRHVPHEALILFEHRPESSISLINFGAGIGLQELASSRTEQTRPFIAMQFSVPVSAQSTLSSRTSIPVNTPTAHNAGEIETSIGLNFRF